MIWISSKIQNFKSHWHRWFAWYPVTLKVYPYGSKKKVWLQTILRKGIGTHQDLDGKVTTWHFEYKELF